MSATGSSGGGGANLYADTPVMHVASRSLYAASAQMLSHAVPHVVGPAGLDDVSIRKCLELNARAAQLVTHLDAGSWNLAGGAMAVDSSIYTILTQEADNLAKFTGTGGGTSAAAGAVPNFPPAPTIPDVPVPEVPSPPEVMDAEYISTLVNSGVGAEPHEAAAQHWEKVGQSLSQVADVVEVAANALAAGWQSPEAEGAHRALKNFHSWVSDVGRSASDLGRDWHAHAASWRRLKNNIPTPQEARQTKQDLIQAMSDNEADGGLSTPRVVFYTGQYNKHNADTSVEMTAYDTSQSPAPAGSGPAGPPPISSQGPPRVDGTPLPQPGPLQDKLTDNPELQKLGDPKAIMTAMMAGVAGAAGGLTAIKGAGTGLLQPIQAIPGQIAQQVSQIGSMAAKAGAPNAAALHKPLSGTAAKKAGGGGGKGGGGGGVKPAGLGGGAKLATPPPVAIPAAPSSPAVGPVTPAAAGTAGAGGMGSPGMMPIGAMGAARSNRKDKARNKELFPDEPVIDSDADHVPAVLGAKPEPTAQKPTYGHKVVKKNQTASEPHDG